MMKIRGGRQRIADVSQKQLLISNVIYKLSVLVSTGPCLPEQLQILARELHKSVKLGLSYGQNGHECCRLAFPKIHLSSMFGEAQVKNQGIV